MTTPEPQGTPEDEEQERDPFPLFESPRFIALELTNFLSYKSATLDFGDFTALIGPNASGKSNAVAAIKLLRDIPTYGLPTALARRGGFDQLRHRSQGRPNDPAIRLVFAFGNAESSYYELSLAAVKGKRYRVKRERAVINFGARGQTYLDSDGSKVTWAEVDNDESVSERSTPVPPGQSALTSGNLAAYIVYSALLSMQAVEIHPARVGELQDPSSTREFEPSGSNTASVFEALDPAGRASLAERLSAIVPGIARIEPRNYADKQTLAFVQQTEHGNREFLAKQMSDGTLRAFGILLAMTQPTRPKLLVIEEPEIAIHLGALQSLVEILRAESSNVQILVTTHSADIVDSLPIDALRVVWNDSERSHISLVSEHTRDVLRRGLMSPGELLRADALDPEVSA